MSCKTRKTFKKRKTLICKTRDFIQTFGSNESFPVFDKAEKVILLLLIPFYGEMDAMESVESDETQFD